MRKRTNPWVAVDVADALYQQLKALEFPAFRPRCGVCCGWNVGPNGETDRAHTADCPVAKALRDYENTHLDKIFCSRA